MYPKFSSISTLTALLICVSSCSAFAHSEHGGHSEPVTAKAAAPASPSWTSHALLRANMSRGASPGLKLEAAGSSFDQVQLQTPEVPQAVVLQGGPSAWTVSKPQMGTGGHLWFVASKEEGNQVLRATTYFFFPAKHQVPTEMLRAPRGGLEIVPMRLQEHGGTREGSRWRFLLRHENQALANHSLQMETEGGTRQTVTSDANGIAEVTFPRDFLPERLTSKEGMNARQDFVLSVRHEAGGKQYLTTYNHSYNPERMRERSLPIGVGVLALGMVLATPLLRRKGKKNA